MNLACICLFYIRNNPLASIIEGISHVRNLKILCVGIIDSMHMSSINLFNFIWTPILQTTAGTKQIHPGMIFILMLISFLIQNKILEMTNGIALKSNIKIFNYYFLCCLIVIFFMLNFILIYLIDIWTTRLICLILIAVLI